MKQCCIYCLRIGSCKKACANIDTLNQTINRTFQCDFCAEIGCYKENTLIANLVEENKVLSSTNRKLNRQILKLQKIKISAIVVAAFNCFGNYQSLLAMNDLKSAIAESDKEESDDKLAT